MADLQQVQEDIRKADAEIDNCKSELEKVWKQDEKEYLRTQVEQLRKEEQQLRSKELLLLQPAGADGQQDSRSIKRHLKEELEKFEQRFDKKLKVTVTATGTAEQQGGRLLEETRPDISIIDLLGPMTHRRTTSKALHLIKEDFATLQANKSAGESKAKDMLDKAGSHKAAAFRMQQRLQQLKHSQPHRQKWFFVSLGQESLELWLFTTIDEDKQVSSLRSGDLRLCDSATSEGLQTLLRLLNSSDKQLGYMPPALPSQLELQRGGGTLDCLHILRCHGDTRILTANWQGEKVFVKETSEAAIEMEAMAYRRSAGIEGVAQLINAAVSRQGTGWLVARPLCPFTLRDWRLDQHGADTLLELIRQVATTVGRLAASALLHGDISPGNIGWHQHVDGSVQATLLDLRTLRNLSMLQAADQVTGTPAYMALELLEAGGREVSQTVSTELQSLMYCFIHSATRHKLHWAHRAMIDAAAVDMKALPLVCDRYFQSKILSRMSESSLKIVAVKLKGLFDLGNSNRPEVSVQQFIECCSPMSV